MSEIYKTKEGGLYFVTFSVIGWLDVFIKRTYQDVLVDSFRFCQKRKGLQLFEYCIMPSHIHFIASRKKGKLSDIFRDMKSYTAKQLMETISNNSRESRRELFLREFRRHGKLSSQEQNNQFWKHDNHPFSLETSRMIDQKTNYIHQNPVKAGFVDEPWKWRLSSANPDSPIKVMDL